MSSAVRFAAVALLAATPAFATPAEMDASPHASLERAWQLGQDERFVDPIYPEPCRHLADVADTHGEGRYIEALTHAAYQNDTPVLLRVCALSELRLRDPRRVDEARLLSMASNADPLLTAAAARLLARTGSEKAKAQALAQLRRTLPMLEQAEMLSAVAIAELLASGKDRTATRAYVTQFLQTNCVARATPWGESATMELIGIFGSVATKADLDARVFGRCGPAFGDTPRDATGLHPRPYDTWELVADDEERHGVRLTALENAARLAPADRRIDAVLGKLLKHERSTVVRGTLYFLSRVPPEVRARVAADVRRLTTDRDPGVAAAAKRVASDAP